MIINSMFMVILLTLFCLVTVSTTFNYESNILGPLWFNIMLVLALISGAVRKLFTSNLAYFSSRYNNNQTDRGRLLSVTISLNK